MEQIKVNEVSSILKKGQFGYTIITKTTPKMNKTANPYFGRVEKVSIYKNAMLGCSYTNIVNNRLESEGKERNFTAQAPKGKKFYNSFFYQSEKDENTFYLKIAFYKERSQITSNFLIDGNIATPNQIQEIKNFLPKNSSSAAHQGLSEENEVKMITVKFENVCTILQGERIIYITNNKNDFAEAV